MSFDFAKQKNDPPMSKGDCYALVCEEQATKQSLFMSTAQANYEYCFGDSNNAQQCNPNARAKLSDSGKCICQDPYTGDLCESCKSGSKQSKVDGHTVCSAEE